MLGSNDGRDDRDGSKLASLVGLAEDDGNDVGRCVGSAENEGISDGEADSVEEGGLECPVTLTLGLMDGDDDGPELGLELELGTPDA